MSQWQVMEGDCVALLATLPAESIDACVTDPPYGIGFMGKEWDTFKPSVAEQKQGLRQINKSEHYSRKAKRAANPNLKGRTVGGAISSSQIAYDYSLAGLRGFQEWTEAWAAEVLRVLKPGGYAVVCGAPRAYHRMACGLEDAGFEIRDCLAWLFGSGFPKSLNLGNGLGTALKPAHEPIVLARKPFKGTVKANVEKHGTGALNVDACRVQLDGDHKTRGGRGVNSGVTGWQPSAEYDETIGRWPANVVLDEIAALVLDEQSGELHPNANKQERTRSGGIWANAVGSGCAGPAYFDNGGASRFYYIAKPSREERDYGCAGLKARSSLETVSRDPSSAGANNPRAGAGRTSVLNTCEVVYNVAWVDAVLSRRLQPDTDQSRKKAITGSTTLCSDGSAWSMCWCGSPSTDPYHPAVMSIIETETNYTTTSITLNSSRRPHTNGCMAAAFGVVASGGNLAAYAEFQSPWKRHTGTSLKRDGHSTADANLATSVSSWLTSAPVGGGHRVEARRNFHPT